MMQRLQKNEPWTNLSEKLRPCIIYLDPLWKVDSSIGMIVQLFLEAALCHSLGENEYMQKRFSVYSGDFLITPETIKDFQAVIPRQRNTSDCGLFVLEYIESFGSDENAKSFIDNLYTKGHMVQWFPHSQISNKRVLLINIMMNHVNGLDMPLCVEEYLEKKKYIHSITEDDSTEYEFFEDTQGLDYEKIDKFYENMPGCLEYKSLSKQSSMTAKLSSSSPVFTEIE